MSPTQRTLKEMRGRGYVADVTERWNPFAKIRQDLFGIVDVLCLGENEVVAVQTTSASNLNARVKKIADHESTPALRKAGVRILAHGWKKAKNGRYTLKEIDVS